MTCWLAPFSRLVQQDPDAVALADSTGQLSRHDLWSRVEAWSRALLRSGVLPGDRVLVHVEASLQAWVALLAVLASGATALPVPAGHGPGDLRRLIHRWQPSACLVSSPWHDVYPPAGGTPARHVDVSTLPCLHAGPTPWTEPEGREPFRFAVRGQILLLDELGAGYLHQPAQVLANARALFEACPLVAEASGFLGLPSGHWAHLVAGFGLLAAGRPLSLPTRMQDGLALGLPFEAGPMICLTTAKRWARGLGDHHAQLERAAVRQLILVYGMTSGTMVPATRDELPRIPISMIQGSARHLAATHLGIEDTAPPPGCIGFALPGLRIRVMRNRFHEARNDRPGYLVCELHPNAQAIPLETGPKLRMGQAHGLAASRGAMEASSLGIGWQDHQGRLYQLQSPQHLIRTAGSIVVPADLEQRLLDSGLVDEAIAFGVPHPALEEAVVLMAVARPRVTPSQVRQFCQATMPPSMVPQRIELHDRLPGCSLGGPGRDDLRLRYSGLFQA